MLENYITLEELEQQYKDYYQYEFLSNGRLTGYIVEDEEYINYATLEDKILQGEYEFISIPCDEVAIFRDKVNNTLIEIRYA